MHRLLPIAIGVVVLAAMVASCSTTPPHRKPAPEQWHPPVAMLEKYADKTGVVTRAAMETGLKADFDRIDISHDGCLNQEEVRTENQRRWELDASTYSPLIDFKQTGCVDFQEYSETARSLFDQLDRNGDGKLTPDELHPGAAPQPGSNPPTERHHGNPGNFETP